MNKLILHPTDTCQWHAMVNDAQIATNLMLDVDTESYLVFLLMRFAQQAQFLESVIALDFLDSMKSSGKRQVDLLQEVGDKSLLFCGLFPGMARKRNVSLAYFSGLGQSAYLAISELGEKDVALLYMQLGNQFGNLQQILQAMRSHYFKQETAGSCIFKSAGFSIN
jgi:hypothetical protein